MNRFLAGNILNLVLLFFSTGICAQQKPVVIPGSQSIQLHSKIVNQDYELQILLPASYSKNSKTYPVIYLMDSQWDFPLVKSIYGQQYYDGFIPELIIVGVTWAGTHANADSLRARDYTPTNELRIPQSGGADQFLAFMKKELFPFIETNFKADSSNRTLMGCSLGGLLTLYCLFTQPALFSGYIAASPAFGWDRESIYRYEKKFYGERLKKPLSLYLSIGDIERNRDGFERLSRHIESRQYPLLRLKSKILDNTGHSGTKSETYSRGLQFVFERPDLPLADTVLNKYTGRYGSASGIPFEIRNENNHLVLYWANGNKDKLHAISELDYYSNAEFMKVRFKKDNEKVKGFDWERYGTTIFISKIF